MIRGTIEHVPCSRLVLRPGDRDRLAELARLLSVPSGLAKRARMVLLAAEGRPNAEIARVAGVSRPTVIGWRDRYEQGGIAALEDAPRSGRPAEVDEIEVVVVVMTLSGDGVPPARLGITHWSARFLAAELWTSFSTVARTWRRWGIQPHRIETFKFSTDPQLEAKIRDVVKPVPGPARQRGRRQRRRESQIQALDRTSSAPSGIRTCTVLLHVISETACHAGHLDAARELTSGRTWLIS